MYKHSILLADHCAIARWGLRGVLEQEHDWEVVGEAANGYDTVKKATELRPDLLILNSAMPRLSGLDGVRRIRAAVPNARILVLVTFSDKELMKALFDRMVDGIALYSDSVEQLRSCVRTVLKGERCVTSNEVHYSREPRFRSGGLTTREQQVLALLWEGMCSKEIAAALRLSVRTVENHRARMMRRVESRSVAELLRYGIRQGVIHA